MRNEIILNNKSSKEITGLLIQELPPISKPMIRTTVEEIDGRDGDIITKLGYSAYNKEISIGLYGDFDINEVIKYFDSEGVVVFSNEPDKYYKYQIIDQIDFERLIRFRIAKVTMHCQPFKYSTTEEPEEFEPGQTTGEGSEIELRPSAVSKINLNAAKGDTEQQTYSGKNLLNAFANYKAGQSYTHRGVTFTFNADGSIKVKGTATGGVAYVNLWGAIENDYTTTKLNIPNPYQVGSWTDQNIILSCRTTSGTYFDIYKGSGATTGNYGGMAVGAFYLQVPSGSNVDETIYPQIVSGSTLPEFEPYVGGIASPNPDYPQTVQIVTGEQIITIDDMDEQSQNFTVDLGDIELCKIGTYQDYIYKNGDDWYLRKNTWKVVFDGSESWYYNSNNKNLICQSSYTDYLPSGHGYVGFSEGGASVLCNYFVPRQVGQSGGDGRCYAENFDTLFFVCNYGGRTNFNSSANFKSWLSTHNMTVYYQLDTPYDTQITDENLIEQLEALANANSYDEVTHVKSESENKPIILNMSVLSGISCEVTNEGNIYSKPTLTIYGSGTINLSLNNEQMFVIDLGEEDNYVTIDTNAMEAYKDTIDNLMNRSVDGNYNNFKLNIGTNTISWSGNLTKIVIDNYSRWI